MHERAGIARNGGAGPSSKRMMRLDDLDTIKAGKSADSSVLKPPWTTSRTPAASSDVYLRGAAVERETLSAAWSAARPGWGGEGPVAGPPAGAAATGSPMRAQYAS